ncbi:MAG: type II secretion system minor pseudopilin GspK [Nitrospirota bacterium]
MMNKRLLKTEKGMALVITLVILVILTAMVTEFSYGVYTSTASLGNWKESQRLSLIARSGVRLSVKTVSDLYQLYSYTYPGRVDLPVENIVGGFDGSLVITVEDENSRFNLNSLVFQNGTLNSEAYTVFRRLLRNLGLEENISDILADWMDRDSAPRAGATEESAKNSHIDSSDELLTIRGISPDTYERLLPYITVYGYLRRDSALINVNTATIPVIMSIDDRITTDLAERVVRYREIEPFRKTSDLVKVAGFEGSLGQSLMSKIIVKASNYRIRASAENNKIKRVIDAVVEIKGSDNNLVRYWKEI